jgi:hypothetical protein
MWDLDSAKQSQSTSWKSSRFDANLQAIEYKLYIQYGHQHSIIDIFSFKFW